MLRSDRPRTGYQKKRECLFGGGGGDNPASPGGPVPDHRRLRPSQKYRVIRLRQPCTEECSKHRIGPLNGKSCFWSFGKGNAWNPGFSKNCGKGAGQKRSIFPAEGCDELNGEFRGGSFAVCVNGRVSAAGRPESGTKWTLFHPILEESCAGMHFATGARCRIPL